MLITASVWLSTVSCTFYFLEFFIFCAWLQVLKLQIYMREAERNSFDAYLMAGSGEKAL